MTKEEILQSEEKLSKKQNERKLALLLMESNNNNSRLTKVWSRYYRGRYYRGVTVLLILDITELHISFLGFIRYLPFQCNSFDQTSEKSLQMILKTAKSRYLKTHNDYLWVQYHFLMSIDVDLANVPYRFNTLEYHTVLSSSCICSLLLTGQSSKKSIQLSCAKNENSSRWTLISILMKHRMGLNQQSNIWCLCYFLCCWASLMYLQDWNSYCNQNIACWAFAYACMLGYQHCVSF